MTRERQTAGLVLAGLLAAVLVGAEAVEQLRGGWLSKAWGAGILLVGWWGMLAVTEIQRERDAFEALLRKHGNAGA
jgi:hypothetical protein